jgi:hypothetical protein
MKLVRVLLFFGVFVLVGSIGASTIETFGPVPDCQAHPNQPRCN